MRQLGNAINDSLSDSESVSGALSDLREAGYDVVLILEATIGFHKRGEVAAKVSTATALPSGELVLNAQDASFLKSLRIRLDSGDDVSAS
ncbi:MAG TPA: hypothetical protein VIC04_06060 [Terriglobia bacterium]